uniref:BH4_AAA_HYDROXYL_2 domain-containing protein n=1 Tax=Heterorhabditis bacteriophora TaxID=37862 RepID=A0A1I7X2K6_HETBA
MAPVPGDPFTKPSASLDEPKLEDRWRSTDLHYRPIDHDERFHAILTMDEYQSDEKKIRDAVLFCKEKVDSLKTIGYPLFTGLTNAANFDEFTRFVSYKVQSLDFKVIYIKLIFYTLSNVLDSITFSMLHITCIIYVYIYKCIGKYYLPNIIIVVLLLQISVKDLDFSLKCNEIWENDSVAYRCNTCALTPCKL